MYFAQVKTLSESAKPWDYYKILGTYLGYQVFRSLADGGCRWWRVDAARLSPESAARPACLIGDLCRWSEKPV